MRRPNTAKKTDHCPLHAPKSCPAPNNDSPQEIIQQYGPFVWRTVRALGVRSEDVPDVCQEVFIVICRKLGDFEGRSALSTWIYAVCLRRVQSYQRSLARRKESPVTQLPDQDVPARQIDDISKNQRQTLLLEAIGQLKKAEREVFVLYEIEEKSIAEVAQIVERPQRTVYDLRNRARKSIECFWKKAIRQGRIDP